MKKARKLWTLKSTFASTDGKERSFSYRFHPSLFKLDENTFDLDLARLSLAKAISSYNGVGEYEKRDQHIKAFHHKLGFLGVYTNEDYQTRPTEHSVGVCFAFRPYFTFTLVSIGIRSGGYEREWASNFNFGEEGHHEGFQEAAKTVIEELASYLKKYRLNRKKRLRFWISGYSRGAAIANLVAAELIHQTNPGTAEILADAMNLNLRSGVKSSVYAYTFESPSPAVFRNQDACMEHIFNCYSKSDIVAYTPFQFMGFRRYGKDIELNVDITNIEHIEDLLPDYKYRSFSVKLLSGIKVIDNEKAATKEQFIQEMLSFFENDMHLTRREYVQYYQFALGKLVAFLKSSDGDLIKAIFSQISIAKALASLLNIRLFSRYVHSIIDPFHLGFESEPLEKTIEGCFNLIHAMIHIDKDQGFSHILTLGLSGASLFDEHSIEIIYTYFNQIEEGDIQR